MKVLLVSNLFPDAANPNCGPYNARLVKHLGALCEVRVVAPRPTPGISPFWSPESFSARTEDAAFAPLFEGGQDPFALRPGTIDPFGLRNHLSKPIVVAVQGISFTIAIEMDVNPTPNNTPTQSGIATQYPEEPVQDAFCDQQKQMGQREVLRRRALPFQYS